MTANILIRILIVINIATASVSDTSSSAEQNSNCADTMTYCNAMSKYCNNEEYKGVRMYCKKTCKSCDEDFTTFESTQSTDNDGDGQSLVTLLVFKRANIQNVRNAHTAPNSATVTNPTCCVIV